MLESLGKNLPRNYFNLDQEHDFTAEAGIIYPIYQKMLMPGDLIEVENACLIRQLPTIAPSLSKFKAKFWDVVVAVRNIYPEITQFLSGHEEYTSEEPYNEPLPRWIPKDIEKTRPGTLWDFLENPTSIIPDEDSCQVDFYRMAYGYIYDILFRNETRQPSILVKGVPGSWKGEDLLRINFDKDYLTTSLPKQQLGDPLAISISGIGNADWNGSRGPINIEEDYGAVRAVFGTTQDGEHVSALLTGSGPNNPTPVQDIVTNALNRNIINFNNAGSIYLSTLRESIAHQSMQEINAMAGIRPNEFYEAHWGERPTDEALQYPEVFGREELDIITSEVLQTSESSQNSPLGTMGGHGMGKGRGRRKKFYAKEFSIYMKLFYIKTNTLYGGQQAKREYTQKTIYDFPFPELNHISLQPIYGRELLTASSYIIYSDNNGKTLKAGNTDPTAIDYNKSIKGYDTNFYWEREKLPRISGLLKQEQYKKENNAEAEIAYNFNLYNWTEARFFKDKNGERPSINDDFLKFKLDNRNFQIVDDTVNRSQFIVRHLNKVDAWRTLSKKGLPSTLGLF